MTVDFERTKRDLSGRSILVTSWYDDQKQNWRASAPAYSQVSTQSSADQEICTSRSAAIEKIVRMLQAYFGEMEAGHAPITESKKVYR